MACVERCLVDVVWLLFTAANTALTYLIADAVADGKFTMNATTGLISTSARLDRETRDSYIITGCH